MRQSATRKEIVEDITITRDSELMVAQAAGESEAGVDFIDAWIPYSADTKYVVVDAGCIIIAEDAIDNFITAAIERGLKVEKV